MKPWKAALGEYPSNHSKRKRKNKEKERKRKEKRKIPKDTKEKEPRCKKM